MHLTRNFDEKMSESAGLHDVDVVTILVQARTVAAGFGLYCVMGESKRSIPV